MNNFLDEYLKEITTLLTLTEQVRAGLERAKEQIINCSRSKGTVYILGNGGSAAMASHVTVDLVKSASIKAQNFNDADFITCYANDYGYANWMKEALDKYATQNDLVILISSSGASKNIIHAAEWCLENNIDFITLTGGSSDNPLKNINNPGVNLWVDSKAYNHIEMVHHIWLLALVDCIIGKSIYPPTPEGYKKL